MQPVAHFTIAHFIRGVLVLLHTPCWVMSSRITDKWRKANKWYWDFLFPFTRPGPGLVRSTCLWHLPVPHEINMNFGTTFSGKKADLQHCVIANTSGMIKRDSLKSTLYCLSKPRLKPAPCPKHQWNNNNKKYYINVPVLNNQLRINSLLSRFAFQWAHAVHLGDRHRTEQKCSSFGCCNS